MLDVERWAELRREHFVRGVSIKELVRRTGLARNTVRVALRSDTPPVFSVPERPSKLEPFKDEIHGLLRDDPKLPGVRVRELIEPLGFDGGKTIVDDYLREIRPMFLRPRTHQRTVYRPGEICQWDLWETSRPVPVGHGQDRRGVGRGRVPGLFAGGCGRVDLQQGGAGRAVGHEPLPVVVGCAAGADGVGPRGMPARARRPADRGVCGVLRSAAGRLAVLRAGGPAGEGVCRAAAGIHGDELRTRPEVRESPRLSAAARRLVREGERAHAQDAAGPADRPADRGAGADAAAARAGA